MSVRRVRRSRRLTRWGGASPIASTAPIWRQRARIADAFTGLLTPQDQAGWRPHVTVQNKVAPGEAKALLAELSRGFVARPVSIIGLAAWWYRGGPWEPLSRHLFR